MTAARTYEFHPFAGLFPLLDKDSHGFKALVEDIKANRQQDPIWLLEGKVLDGRNRYLACQHLGIDPLTREYIGSDPIGFVLSVNLHRRHLNTSQRAMVAAKLANLEPGANQHTKPGTSIEVASKLLNVGRASVERALQVLKKGDPSAIEEVEQGKTSVTEAAKGKDKGKEKDKKKDKDENEEPTAAPPTDCTVLYHLSPNSVPSEVYEFLTDVWDEAQLAELASLLMNHVTPEVGEETEEKDTIPPVREPQLEEV